MSMRGGFCLEEKKRRFPPQTQSTANNNTTHQQTHHPRTHTHCFALIEHTYRDVRGWRFHSLAALSFVLPTPRIDRRFRPTDQNKHTDERNTPITSCSRTRRVFPRSTHTVLSVWFVVVVVWSVNRRPHTLSRRVQTARERRKDRETKRTTTPTHARVGTQRGQPAASLSPLLSYSMDFSSSPPPLEDPLGRPPRRRSRSPHSPHQSPVRMEVDLITVDTPTPPAPQPYDEDAHPGGVVPSSSDVDHHDDDDDSEELDLNQFLETCARCHQPLDKDLYINLCGHVYHGKW